MHYIYSRPLKLIIILILCSLVFYTFMEIRLKNNKVWKILNSLLAVFMFGIIIYLTLLNRKSEEVVLQLRPFISFKIAAERQPEYYREMLMNVFLFVPFGLSLPYLWPKEWKAGKKTVLTIMIAMLLSIVIEISQYHWKLGYVETDDVIMNTLGAALGAVHLLLACWLRCITKENE